MTKRIFISVLALAGIVLSGCQSDAAAAKSQAARLANLKGGMVRILSFALYPAHYDSLELAKRMDADIRTVRLGSAYYPNDFDRKIVYWVEARVTEDSMTKDALSALARPSDVLVIGPSPEWKSYPQSVRAGIMKKISSGTPALIFSPKEEFNKELADNGIALKPIQLNTNRFPGIKEDAVFAPKYYRAGKGTVAVLDNPIVYNRGYLISSSAQRAYDEYKYDRIANLLYKLARKDDGAITGISTDAKECRLSINASDHARVASFILRNTDYAAVTSRSITVPAQSTTVTTALPTLPNGEYIAEFRIAERGKLIDWVSAPVKVEINPSISSAKTEKNVLAEGDRLHIDLSYVGNVKASSLLLDLEDTYGRRYFSKVYPTAPSKIDLQVPAGSLSVINFAKVSLYNKSSLLDSRVVEFMQPAKARENDFHILLWSGLVTDVKGKRYLDVLSDYGITGLSNTPADAATARAIALSNLRSIPYTTFLWQLKLDETLFNDKWLQDRKNDCISNARAFKDYGRLAYTLGDEIQLGAAFKEGRFSNSPAVTDAFRKYLEKTYVTIDALNAQWGTTYKAFSDIVLTTDADLAKNSDNPSPWVDYHMFLTDAFVRLQYEFRDLIRSVDPGAKVGYDGCEQYSSFDGYDWYQYCTGFDFNNIYSQYFINGGYPNKVFNGLCQRSFADRDNLRGAWVNGAEINTGMEYTAWYLALAGYNSIFWWTGGSLGPEVDAFDVDLKPSPIFKKMLVPAKEIQKGAATVIKHADQHRDPIAIYYSESNWHASTLSSGTGGHVNYLGLTSDDWFKRPMNPDPEMRYLVDGVNPAGHYAVSVKNFAALFHDLGYQPEMLAKQQIEVGELNSGNYRVLVLPFVESLSEREIQEIYKFVEGGGMVIADYRTGIRDAHCRMYKSSPLDKLFGIQRPTFDVKMRPTMIQLDDLPRCLIFGQVNALFVHPDLKLAGGTAYGHNDEGVPVYICNTYGKGRTLFLNCDLYSYFDARRSGNENDYRESFRRLLKTDADLSPKYEVMADGSPAPYTEVFAYSDGPVDLIGIIRDYSVNNHTDFRISVPLHRRGHVYSVRDGAYLGRTDRASTTLKSGDALLLAVMPYQVKGVQIKGPAAVKRGERITMNLAVQANGTERLCNHVVRVEVTDAAKHTRAYLTENLYLRNGTGSFTLPIALNDPAGKWTIAVRDVISGTHSLKEFEVK